MDKYFVFRKMLDFIAENGNVTDADMDYVGRIRVTGECDGLEVIVEVKMTEVFKDA